MVLDIRALVDLKSTHGNGNSSLVKQVNDHLSWIVIDILSMMLHISMYASALVRWKPLWKKLKLIQSIIGDQTSLFREIRRGTIVGLSLLLVVIKQLKSNIALLEISMRTDNNLI